MLEIAGPLEDEIRARLEADYGLRVRDVRRLTLGADPQAASHHLATHEGDVYFLKLRRDAPPPASLEVSQWLAERLALPVVAPLATRDGAFSTRFQGLTAILYPHVEGRSGWEASLSPGQWRRLGEALRGLHDATLPEELARDLPRECYAPVWRDAVLARLDDLEVSALARQGASAARLAELLVGEKREIRDVVARAAALAESLAEAPPPLCLCHGDIHAGNVLVDGEHLHLVDWDGLVWAPRERDLMFFGAGIGGVWNREEEAEWFYWGYQHDRSAVEVHREALAYYRFERIVQDIGETCEAVFDATVGEADQAVLVAHLAAHFAPGNLAEMAYATARRLPCLGRR